MSRITRIAALMLAAIAPTLAMAQGQKQDEEYGKLIKQMLRDPRISTELVDHLPASDKVPTPLKHFGHIMGAWGILDKSGPMNDYLAAIAKAETAREFGSRREALQLEVRNLESAFEDSYRKALESSRKMADYERMRQDDPKRTHEFLYEAVVNAIGRQRSARNMSDREAILQLKDVGECSDGRQGDQCTGPDHAAASEALGEQVLDRLLGGLCCFHDGQFKVQACFFAFSASLSCSASRPFSKGKLRFTGGR